MAAEDMARLIAKSDALKIFQEVNYKKDTENAFDEIGSQPIAIDNELVGLSREDEEEKGSEVVHASFDIIEAEFTKKEARDRMPEREWGLKADATKVPDCLTGAMYDVRESMNEIIDGLGVVMNMSDASGDDPSAGPAVGALRTITPPTKQNDQAGAASGSGSGDATGLRNVASGGVTEI